MEIREQSRSGVRIVDAGWEKEILGCANSAEEIQIVCPFIKERTVRALVAVAKAHRISVITRLNAQDFFQGVSDLSALRYLRGLGAEIRAIKGLHSKLYIFDRSTAVITSANLTRAALRENKEFGAVFSSGAPVESSISYFKKLWDGAGGNIGADSLDECEKQVLEAQVRGEFKTPSDLKDYGVSFSEPELEPDLQIPRSESSGLELYESPPSSFVKFFGTGDYRVPLDQPIWAEVEESGSHWACTSSKRHNQPKDGTVMFLTRTVEDQDYRIYGVALTLRHVRGRDEATWGDINRRFWKSEWPYYVRVHHPMFIAGTLENGISLKQMMDALGHECFASTQRNYESGNGQTDPGQTLRQQHSRELTPKAHAWLLRELAGRFADFGVIPNYEIERLDRPTIANNNEIAVRQEIERILKLKNTSHPVSLLFKRVVAGVSDWDGVIVDTTADRITFAAGSRPLQFAECEPQSQRIRFQIRDIDYSTATGEIDRVPSSHGWTLRKFFFTKKDDEIDEVLKVLKQSFSDVRGNR